MLPLTDVVFNTEAHAFPRFQLGKLFTTGWERKPRDAEGNIIGEPKRETETKENGNTAQQPPALEKVVVPDPAAQRAAERVPEATPPTAAAPAADVARDPVTGKEAESS